MNGTQLRFILHPSSFILKSLHYATREVTTMNIGLRALSLLFALLLIGAANAQTPTLTAIKAGRLIDPETGTASANQVILIEGERIKAVGSDVAIPAGANLIDLSKLTVLPGFVDAHTHTAMTYKEQPENNYYYLTYITDSSPLRAIQAASNAIQLLNSGFTIIRDVGNNALYADCALRQAIEQGWLPGPTVIPSGPMIGWPRSSFLTCNENSSVRPER